MEVSNQQIPTTLTQKDHLKTLEEVIAKSEKAFYETGSALREIREQKLYRLKGYKDFESYCLKEWEFTRRRADQLIQAAECKDLLTRNNCSQIPPNEAQIRALSKLPPEQQAEVWQQITQENSDSKVTAKKVKEFIEQIQQNAGTIQEKFLVTKDAKRIHKALSVLSEYESGKIREAILSDSGEALQMPQLVEKILLNFKNLEL